MSEPKEFTCPKCGGHHFGSDVETGTDGKPKVGEMVTCQSVVSSRYIGHLKANSYCWFRCTRREAGL